MRKNFIKWKTKFEYIFFAIKTNNNFLFCIFFERGTKSYNCILIRIQKAAPLNSKPELQHICQFSGTKNQNENKLLSIRSLFIYFSSKLHQIHQVQNGLKYSKQRRS